MLKFSKIRTHFMLRKNGFHASDSLKTNFNGPIFEDSDEAGIRVVIQNYHENVMAAFSEKISKSSSAVKLKFNKIRTHFTGATLHRSKLTRYFLGNSAIISRGTTDSSMHLERNK